MRLIRALRDCKQRSLIVSKKAPAVSKKLPPTEIEREKEFKKEEKDKQKTMIKRMLKRKKQEIIKKEKKETR